MDYGMRHLRFADYRVTAREKGPGEMREIASSAVSVSSNAAPEWRISMATISEDAPFSSFPGMKRSLGVVDGAGIELIVASRRRLMHVGDEPAVFPGDVSASARPLDGPAFFLNLLVNPTRTLGRMVAIRAGCHDLAGLFWFVVALADGLELRINDREPFPLPRLDTVKLDLRAGPLVRLTLTRPDVEAPGASADGPVAYLISVSR